MRRARAFGLLMLSTASIASACSYDFDAFAPPGDGGNETDGAGPVTPGADGSGAGDGATGSDSATPGEDGNPPADGAPSDGGPTDSGPQPDACTGSAPCIATATSCGQACGATGATCEAACPNNKCRQDCRAAARDCRMGCKNTCISCAQTAACPAPAECDAASQAN